MALSSSSSSVSLMGALILHVDGSADAWRKTDADESIPAMILHVNSGKTDLRYSASAPLPPPG
jgi:hypothetical protein